MNTQKHFLLAGLILVYFQCYGQKTANQIVHDKSFNWTITIPENFERVSEEEWAKIQNKGTEAIEKTYDAQVINQAKIIFVFRRDQFNYFESNYQPFDPLVDGDYLESCGKVAEVLYRTFVTQMPNAKVDTTSSVELIDNLEFRKFAVKVEFPNKMVLHVLMFTRLFDKREFTVNIMYVDKIRGEEMLGAWRRSKFDK